MSWDYRLCKRTYGPPHPLYDDFETSFAIHEVYYSKKGKIVGYTEQAVSFHGDVPGDVVISLHRAMINASTKPVVDLDALDKKFEKARKRAEKKQAAKAVKNTEKDA